MPDHFNFNGNASIEIIFCLLVDPGCTLADDALTHSGTFVRRAGWSFRMRSHRSAKGFNFATNPLM